LWKCSVANSHEGVQDGLKRIDSILWALFL
jgi:hypothetical protein